MNKAMLAKTAWNLSSNTRSLATRILRLKYGTSLQPQARSASLTSQIWKGLGICNETLRKGVCRHIGNGLFTRLWRDP